MNLVDKLLQIDAGQIEVPKKTEKMYCKKLKQELEFECVAVDPEKIGEIQSRAMGINNGDINDVDMFKMKAFTVIEGCKVFKDKVVQEHFNAPTPIELLKKILLDGEISKLYSTIQDLSSYQEAKEDDIKN